MFGAGRAGLNGRDFKFSIVAEDQNIFFLSNKRLFETGLPQTVELRVCRQGIRFWVRLEMILGRTERSSVSEEASGRPE